MLIYYVFSYLFYIFIIFHLSIFSKLLKKFMHYLIMMKTILLSIIFLHAIIIYRYSYNIVCDKLSLYGFFIRFRFFMVFVSRRITNIILRLSGIFYFPLQKYKFPVLVKLELLLTTKKSENFHFLTFR